MQNIDYRHLLEGYNTSSNFVLATENNRIIYANRSAIEIIGTNVQGELIYDIIGEDIFSKASELSIEPHNLHESFSLADCCFFGVNCILNAYGGVPTLYIFTPLRDGDEEIDIDFSSSSLLGFSTEVRKQIAPLLFSNRKNAPYVTKCGYQMIRLISNLSDFVRLGSQAPMMFFMNTDIVSLCNEIVSSARTILDIVGIPIEFHTKQSSCIIMADCQLIRRAVMNLICNSAKYTREGNRIYVSLRFSADQCFLRVSDNGCGISQSEISDIFRTYRTHKIPRLSGGFGLGLAVVRRIALLHGGNAALASKVNDGTDVTISLPIKKARTLKAEEVVVGSSFDSALFELAEILTVDEFETAHNTLNRNTPK